MIVIDTHALVWMIEGDARLGRQATERVDGERAGDGVAIAAITLWEAAMLVDKNRVVLSRSIDGWFDAVLAAEGFNLAAITPSIGIDAGSLPGGIHGDPADRLIIATARALGCPVLTVDRNILGYAEAGHVGALDARR